MARLLIVDDEEADRVVLRTILERDDHTVFEAADGEEALSVYAANPVDVVVTDLHMRNVHGLELISILRDYIPRPGIIAISGTGQDQLTVAQMLGAQKALEKPVTPEALLSAVAEVTPSSAQPPSPS